FLGKQAIVSQTQAGDLQIVWPISNSAAKLKITCTETTMDLALTGTDAPWWLQLVTAEEPELPFTTMAKQSLSCSFEGSPYRVEIPQGNLEQRGRTFQI